MNFRILPAGLVIAITVALSTTPAFGADAPASSTTPAPTLEAPSAAHAPLPAGVATGGLATSPNASSGLQAPSAPTTGPAVPSPASGASMALPGASGQAVSAIAGTVPPVHLPVAPSLPGHAPAPVAPATQEQNPDVPLSITRTTLSADWSLQLHLELPKLLEAPALASLVAATEESLHDAQPQPTPNAAPSVPTPTVGSGATRAVQLAAIEVRPSADAIALMHAQNTIAGLQTDLAVAHDQVRTLTIERDSARADVVTAQRQTRSAMAQVDNQRGLTAIALHQEDRAAQAFEVAAAHGDTTAAANLALLLIDGRGVERDVPRAIGLLEQAAEQGNAMAARNLSSIYKAGIGVLADSDRAWQWEAAARRIEAAGAGVDQTASASP